MRERNERRERVEISKRGKKDLQERRREINEKKRKRERKWPVAFGLNRNSPELLRSFGPKL
ncbi:hypothetical protein EYF80_057068 [Liparis tanakae]|uniref:Uncharacterized protein n=1 Tax=Liparis tanakae TaxID=230148 RepID=A0A4Z2EUZ7_9TELE|nr:hypothetical protein EYF80_057068 [Liparis tanakae]